MKWITSSAGEFSHANSEIQTLSITSFSQTAKEIADKKKPHLNEVFLERAELNSYSEETRTPTTKRSDPSSSTLADETDKTKETHLNVNDHKVITRIRTLSNSNSDYKVNGQTHMNGGSVESPARYITVDNSTSFSKPTVLDVANGHGHKRDQVDGGFPHFTTLNQLHLNKTDPFHRSERRRAEWWLILVSISLGLGNIWRFPNVAYENDGGAFVFAYLIVQIVVAQPLCFLELSLGQFTSGGIATTWRCFPLFKGLMICQKIVTVYVGIYLGVVTAIAMNQVYSFIGSPYNSTETWSNETDNCSELFSLQTHYKLSSEDESFVINTPLLVSLAIIWTAVFVSISWSKITRTAFFVTSTLPSICLVVLLIYSLLQDHALEAVQRFFIPQWDALLNIKIWYAAAGQSLFSLSIGFGHLIIFSQFNDFKHNVLRDSILICVVDTAVSLAAGLLVFVSLASLNCEAVTNFPGVGVTYFAFTSLLSTISNNVVYKICVFLLFFSFSILGIGTLVPIVDCIPNKSRYEERNSHKRKLAVCFIVCFLSFAIGVVYSSGFLSYMMVSLDEYGIEFSITILSAIECIGITWGYGISKFSKDLRFMRDTSLSFWWKIIWTFVAPLGLLSVSIWLRYEDAKVSWNEVPQWSLILGYSLFVLSILQIPLYILRSYSQSDEFGFKMKLRSLVKEEKFWGPSDPVHRFNWLKKREGSATPSRASSAASTLKRRGKDNQAFEMDQG